MTKIKKPAADIQDKKTKKSDGAKGDLENQLKRALADYQNLERRIDEERRLLSALSAALVIEKLLPILDNLENAQKHLKDEGLEMVVKQFGDVLTSEGVEEIPAEGSPFDPNLHQATEILESEKDGIVLKILRKGYKINDKVLRPAQVAVGRRKIEQKVGEKEENFEKEAQQYSS